jgi:hypothetical protein
LHESCRNSGRARPMRFAQLLVPAGIKIFRARDVLSFELLHQTERCVERFPRSSVPREGPLPRGRREEAVQGAGMVGPSHAQGSHCIERVGPSVSKITRARKEKRPGTSGRGRNQEGEALNLTLSAGIRLWAVFKRVRPMNRLRRTSQVHATRLGCWTSGGYVRSVIAPDPPLCAGWRARR